MSKFFNIYLKLIAILLCHQALTTNALRNRIVGGDPTTIDKHKHLVSLRWNDGKFFCGGSLVNNNHVVTAAHCIDLITRDDFNVHGGVTYLNQVGQRRAVEKITKMKAYNNETQNMDVAVLKLTEPMVGPHIATIPLCTHTLTVGDKVTVTGWGLTHEDNVDPSNQLMTANVYMDSHSKCTQQYTGNMKISRSMMCASVPGTKDSCSGDSGGPLVHDGELCGIVSFGEGCGHKSFPGVYTNVNQVKEFINRNIVD